MTYKSPSGVFNYTQVPDDAGDADVKVYVNGEEVSAGGGGGDTVKIATITTAVDCSIFGCLVDLSEEFDLDPGTLPDVFNMSESGAGIYTVALYNGHGIIIITTEEPYNVTGNATKIDSIQDADAYDITGDVTISASTE